MPSAEDIEAEIGIKLVYILKNNKKVCFFKKSMEKFKEILLYILHSNLKGILKD